MQNIIETFIFLIQIYLQLNMRNNDEDVTAYELCRPFFIVKFLRKRFWWMGFQGAHRWDTPNQTPIEVLRNEFTILESTYLVLFLSSLFQKD
jgi:hypothetical protein